MLWAKTRCTATQYNSGRVGSDRGREDSLVISIPGRPVSDSDGWGGLRGGPALSPRPISRPKRDRGAAWCLLWRGEQSNSHRPTPCPAMPCSSRSPAAPAPPLPIVYLVSSCIMCWLPWHHATSSSSSLAPSSPIQSMAFLIYKSHSSPPLAS